MSRLPNTISLMRRGATCTARANPFWLRPIGLRNSSSRISPGCGFCSRPLLDVVVDDFDMRRSSLIPDETYPPLIVDPDRMLPLPVRLQGFKSIARWNAEIAEYPSLIQKTNFSECSVLNICRQLSAPPTGPDHLGFRIGEVLDHG